nr:hypothetical protein [Rhodococcus sp. 06-621-2]
MRSIHRILLGACVCATSALVVFPAAASAAEPTGVTYSFEVDGSTVTNTIINNTGSALACRTSLSPAPGGVLPPVWDVIGTGQTLYSADDTGETGVSTQSVTDVPAGTYMALATCGTQNEDPATVWISDYPGLTEVLATVPWTSYTVQQASPVVTIGEPVPTRADLGSLLGWGSAG